MVKACSRSQGPALASRIGTPGILISGCPLQAGEWDNARQASTVLLRKLVPSASTLC